MGKSTAMHYNKGLQWIAQQHRKEIIFHVLNVIDVCSPDFTCEIRNMTVMGMALASLIRG